MADSFLDTLTDADRIALMEQAFSSVDEVCSQIEGAEWDLPTDCPAWTVKDNLSHLAHFEAVAVGRPQKDVDVAHLPHIRHDFDAMNEKGIEARRPLPGRVILEEFREVTVERIKQLHELDEAAWGENVVLPVGEMPQRMAIGIRTLDVFYHEQDIRRATQKPGHLNGDVSRFVFERMATHAVPRVVSKLAAAPDGSTVVFDVAAPGRTIAVRTEGGRGAPADDTSDAIVTLRCDLEAFFCLLGGRWSPEKARSEGRLVVEGDEDLASRILANIVVVP